MKKKPKVTQLLHWLDAGIFPCKIMFSMGFSYDEINNLLTKKKAWDWKMGLSESRELLEGEGNNFALKRTIYRKTNNKDEVLLFYIILKKQFTFSDWDMIMLAHEILHICQFMLPDILDRNREFESEAYLHSHIMTQCLKILRNKRP